MNAQDLVRELLRLAESHKGTKTAETLVLAADWILKASDVYESFGMRAKGRREAFIHANAATIYAGHVAGRYTEEGSRSLYQIAIEEAGEVFDEMEGGGMTAEERGKARAAADYAAIEETLAYRREMARRILTKPREAVTSTLRSSCAHRCHADNQAFLLSAEERVAVCSLLEEYRDAFDDELDHNADDEMVALRRLHQRLKEAITADRKRDGS